jgi:hypothetical protein
LFSKLLPNTAFCCAPQTLFSEQLGLKRQLERCIFYFGPYRNFF